MRRLAGILLAAAIGLVVVGPAPAGAGTYPDQPIAPCGWLKLEHGGLLIYHGYYTTPCRRAAEVVVTFWRTQHRGQGVVGQWRCNRRRNTVTCKGPKRQWTQGGWYPTNLCPLCGRIHLPPSYRIRGPFGQAS